MKTLWSKCYIALALLLLLTPGLGMAVFGSSGAAANERLSQPPALRSGDGGLNPRVLNESADWLAEHFALRRELVTLWAELNAALGSSAQEQVILGREGWLYYAPSLPDYCGLALSDLELEAIARRLAALQAQAERRGAVFLFTVAPNKSSLYPRYMPAAYPNRYDEGNLARLLPWLETYGVRYADLSALPLPYYRTDSHWTAEGAALAADELLAALGRESRFGEGPFLSGEPRRGDLFEMLYPAREGAEPEIRYGGTLRFRHLNDPKGGDAITIRTEGPGAGRLYCWRDSFGVALYPYLAEAFAEAVFTRSADYVLPEGDYEVFILEIAERNLPSLLGE